jgi:hypothetical protein
MKSMNNITEDPYSYASVAPFTRSKFFTILSGTRGQLPLTTLAPPLLESEYYKSGCSACRRRSTSESMFRRFRPSAAAVALYRACFFVTKLLVGIVFVVFSFRRNSDESLRQQFVDRSIIGA